MKKIKFETLYNGLKSAGYNVEKTVFTDGRPVVIVKHNYEGPYPSKKALETGAAVFKYATRRGYRAEARGYHTATFIF